MKRIALFLIASVLSANLAGAFTVLGPLRDSLTESDRAMALEYVSRLGLRVTPTLRGYAQVGKGLLIVRVESEATCVRGERSCITLLGWRDGGRITHGTFALLSDVWALGGFCDESLGEFSCANFFVDEGLTTMVTITSRATLVSPRIDARSSLAGILYNLNGRQLRLIPPGTYAGQFRTHAEFVAWALGVRAK